MPPISIWEYCHLITTFCNIRLKKGLGTAVKAKIHQSTTLISQHTTTCLKISHSINVCETFRVVSSVTRLLSYGRLTWNYFSRTTSSMSWCCPVRSPHVVLCQKAKRVERSFHQSFPCSRSRLQCYHKNITITFASEPFAKLCTYNHARKILRVIIMSTVTKFQNMGPLLWALQTAYSCEQSSELAGIDYIVPSKSITS